MLTHFTSRSIYNEAMDIIKHISTVKFRASNDFSEYTEVDRGQKKKQRTRVRCLSWHDRSFRQNRFYFFAPSDFFSSFLISVALSSFLPVLMTRAF